MDDLKMKTFTFSSLLIPVTVSSAVSRLSFETTALLDTGSSMTSIYVPLARTLNLNSKDNIISHEANSNSVSLIYTATIELPGGIVFPEMRVADFKNKHPFEVLIGMDIIGNGDFAITTANSDKVVSFRTPHGMPTIDWTQGREEQIADLVDRILAAKRANPAADTSGLEAEIDAAVYALYGLSDDEIRIIEGETK
jgi:hypothetical protein